MTDTQQNNVPELYSYVKVVTPAVYHEDLGMINPAEEEYGIVIYKDANSIQIADELDLNYQLTPDSRILVFNINVVEVEVIEKSSRFVIREHPLTQHSKSFCLVAAGWKAAIYRAMYILNINNPRLLQALEVGNDEAFLDYYHL